MSRDYGAVNLTIKLQKLIVFKSGFRRIQAVIWNETSEHHLVLVNILISKSAPSIKWIEPQGKKVAFDLEQFGQWKNSIVHIKHSEGELVYAKFPELEEINIWAFDQKDAKKQLVELKYHDSYQKTLEI